MGTRRREGAQRRGHRVRHPAPGPGRGVRPGALCGWQLGLPRCQPPPAAHRRAPTQLRGQIPVRPDARCPAPPCNPWADASPRRPAAICGRHGPTRHGGSPNRAAVSPKRPKRPAVSASTMAVAPARGPSAGVVVSLLPAFCCAGDDRSGTNETGVMRTIILNVPTSNTSNGIGLLEHFGSMGLADASAARRGQQDGARVGVAPTSDPTWPTIPSGGGLPAPLPPSPPAAAAAITASHHRRVGLPGRRHRRVISLSAVAAVTDAAFAVAAVAIRAAAAAAAVSLAPAACAAADHHQPRRRGDAAPPPPSPAPSSSHGGGAVADERAQTRHRRPACGALPTGAAGGCGGCAGRASAGCAGCAGRADGAEGCAARPQRRDARARERRRRR